MKSILYSLFIGSFALALTAGGAQAAKENQKGSVRATPQHHVSAAPSGQRSYTTHRTTSSAVHRAAARPTSTTRATVHERNIARNTRTARPTSTTSAAARNRNASVDRNRNVAANRTTNVKTNRERHVATNRNRNVGVNGTTNAAYYRGPVRVTNNWHGNAFHGQRYTVFRNYHRQWHDRNWWRSHYNRIVFVNNGWWYWNAGYWFPAWGYAPSVSFAFDGPIYGYNGLPPDQVTVNVQQQLANAGYYDGPIDGVLGPMTREAIANYQADNGLAVTSAIDEPTLATMGLV